MKTDSFFYRFFLEFPEAFFALIGQRKWRGKGYKFTSVEVKDVNFRFAGIFLPKAKDALLYFVEAQFTKKRVFYPNFLAEIMNYLQKHKTTNDRRAIVFFPITPRIPACISAIANSSRADDCCAFIYPICPKPSSKNFR